MPLKLEQKLPTNLVSGSDALVLPFRKPQLVAYRIDTDGAPPPKILEVTTSYAKDLLHVYPNYFTFGGEAWVELIITSHAEFEEASVQFAVVIEHEGLTKSMGKKFSVVFSSEDNASSPSEIEDLRRKYEAASKALSEERARTSSLEKQLKDMTRAKEALERVATGSKSAGEVEEITKEAKQMIEDDEEPNVPQPDHPDYGARIELVYAGRADNGDYLVDVMLRDMDEDIDVFKSFQFKVYTSMDGALDGKEFNFREHDDLIPSMGNRKGWMDGSRDKSNKVGGFSSSIAALDDNGLLERLRFDDPGDQYRGIKVMVWLEDVVLKWRQFLPITHEPVEFTL